MDAVLFGDVEDALIDWLNGRLTPPVSDRVPKVTTEMLPFVVVERLGGPKASVVTERPIVTVEAWASGWRAAHALSQLARQAVHQIAGENVNGLAFYKVDEFSGPARLPDPVSAKPRFVFTVSLTVRGFTSS